MFPPDVQQVFRKSFELTCGLRLREAHLGCIRSLMRNISLSFSPAFFVHMLGQNLVNLSQAGAAQRTRLKDPSSSHTQFRLHAAISDFNSSVFRRFVGRGTEMLHLTWLQVKTHHVDPVSSRLYSATAALMRFDFLHISKRIASALQVNPIYRFPKQDRIISNQHPLILDQNPSQSILKPSQSQGCHFSKVLNNSVQRVLTMCYQYKCECGIVSIFLCKKVKGEKEPDCGDLQPIVKNQYNTHKATYCTTCLLGPDSAVPEQTGQGYVCCYGANCQAVFPTREKLIKHRNAAPH